MQSPTERFSLSHYARVDDGGEVLIVRAGKCTTERVVPPAGENHAFDVERWTRRVEVYVSPTGRSVRVFVDGTEVVKS